MAGTEGIWSGRIEGGTGEQVVGEQVGLKSKAIVHSTWTSPFRQRQAQSATAVVDTSIKPIAAPARAASIGPSRRTHLY
jgi:hypothetical protein